MIFMDGESLTEKTQSSTECDFPGCKNNATNHCKFCGRHLCDFHLRPKHTGSRRYITGLTDPNLIKIYKEDDESEDGHPCPKYHEQWIKQYEKEQMARENASMDFDTISILVGRELAGDPNSCNVFACSNRPTYTCKICMKRYCTYHASRKPSLLSRLGGHACRGR